MINFSRHQRLAGVLLHPTSLPEGNLSAARRWLDFMAAAGLRVWQVLPLGVPHEDLSPYACLSAFAINPALLDQDKAIDKDDAAFQQWRENEKHWLQDYALFQLLKLQHTGLAWYDWPDVYKFRQPDSISEYRREHAKALRAIAWQQYQLHQAWTEIKQYAAERQIYLFGDMPIFVALDSADVWAHPQRFLLDSDGRPQVVTGVPPDYFSETGQRWGNPHYNWEVMQAEGFRWWLDRLHHHFELFDLVRIDHFRGLESVWMIDAACETAIDGHWQRVPGDTLLQRLQDEMGEIPLIAEDLGIITDEVTALRHQFGLPGMAVLQFGFDEHADNPHKLHNIPPECVVYTGTHDNDTSLGWFRSLNPDMQQQVRRTLCLNTDSDTDTDAATDADSNIDFDVVDALIDNALVCAANLAIIPLQDLLKLGTEARMNTPGIAENNWRWQFQWQQIKPGLTTSIRQRIHAAQRHPPAQPDTVLSPRDTVDHTQVIDEPATRT